MKIYWIILLALILVFPTLAQTETPTPLPTITPTNTATLEPYSYATIESALIGNPSHMTRFDYTASAGDVFIALLLLFILFSIWGMFFFYIFVGRKNV